MMRGFAVLVSALAAVAAQAQEVQTSEAAETPRAATTSESGDRAVVLASRSTLDLRTSPSGRSRSSSPDGGSDAGTLLSGSTSAIGTECLLVETVLDGADLRVRTYKAPSPSKRRGKQDEGWQQDPYVELVVQCGDIYIFRIVSAPKDAWVIKGARLEGPNGEELQVNALRFRAVPRNDINVIVAEAPPGVSVSRLTLHLTGQNGRVAKLDEVELP